MITMTPLDKNRYHADRLNRNSNYVLRRRAFCSPSSRYQNSPAYRLAREGLDVKFTFPNHEHAVDQHVPHSYACLVGSVVRRPVALLPSRRRRGPRPCRPEPGPSSSFEELSSRSFAGRYAVLAIASERLIAL